MARCLNCGKKSFFLKVNDRGLCAECEEQQRLASEAAERKRIEIERINRKIAAKNIYDELCDDYIRIKSFDNLSGEKELTEIINIAQHFCDLIDALVPTDEFEEVYWADCKDQPGKYSGAMHHTFGYTSTGHVYQKIKECGESVNRNLSYFRRTAEETRKFAIMIDSTPSIELGVVQGEKRKDISELKELKTKNVTTRTVMDSLADYIVIDVETTGLQAGRDEIIQLCAVKYLGFQPVEYVCTYVRPRVEISAAAKEVNGITEEQLKCAPRIEEVIDAFSKFIGETTPLVGHNILFDLKFLHYAGCSVLTTKRRYYDTLQLSKKVYDDCSYKLENLIREKLQLRASGAHDAKFDCFAAGSLFKHVCKIITNE